MMMGLMSLAVGPRALYTLFLSFLDNILFQDSDSSRETLFAVHPTMSGYVQMHLNHMHLPWVSLW